MIPYHSLAFAAICLFSSIHLFAAFLPRVKHLWHARFLSFGSGIVTAYVFIDLLPKLSEADELVKPVAHALFPYFEHHVYLLALAGFLLFFTVDKTSKKTNSARYFWFTLSSYALFNFFVGYAIVDKNNPEVRPLLLFTIAMGLHYFVNDFHLNKEHKKAYHLYGKWVLVVALIAGWTMGVFTTVPPAVIALPSAFIAGGVIMNVMRHELPDEGPSSLSAFLLAALFYAAILLMIG